MVKFLSQLSSSIIVGFKMGIIEMLSHKFRSFLSLLGVLLGVAAMVAMLTLMGGMENFMDTIISRWVGNVWIWTKSDIPENEKHIYSRSVGLKFNDGDYLRENVSEVDKIYKSVERWYSATMNGKKNWYRFMGVNKEAIEYYMHNYSIINGRYFNDIEYKKGELICIISNKIKEKMIRSKGVDFNPIGEYLTFKKQRLKIIGIFEVDNKNLESWSMKRRVFVPLLTMQKHALGFNPNPGFIMVRIKDYKELDKGVEAISKGLITKHRGVEDFEYHTAQGATDAISMISNISLIIGIIAAISLLIGGLGIMNVMLSSISERIKEIGVRKALGAGSIHIFIQFITETVTLSIFGGMLGLPLGAIPLLFSKQMEKASGMIPQLSVTHIISVTIVIVLIGIVFGIYPAIKASKMNPIDALRYE